MGILCDVTLNGMLTNITNDCLLQCWCRGESRELGMKNSSRNPSPNMKQDSAPVTVKKMQNILSVFSCPTYWYVVCNFWIVMCNVLSYLPRPTGWPSRAFVGNSVTHSVTPLFLLAPPRACIGGMASTRFPGLFFYIYH